MRRSVSVTLALVALAACAHYRPSPLRDGADVLAPADLALVSAEARTIDRPYLTPQSIDLSQPLTPNQLAILAVLESPDLKALRTRTGVGAAQAFSARLLPDPTFQAGFDKRLSGPDPFNAFAGQVAQDINQLRLRHVANTSAAAGREQVRLDLAWAEWQAAGQARLLGVRVLALTAQLAIARTSAAAAGRVFDATARAVGRGDLAAGDLDTRRQSSLDSADKARAAERDLIAARGELNRQLGLPPATVLRLAPNPDPMPPPSPEQLVTGALTRRLDLQALRAGYQVSEAGLHLATLQQFPALAITAAYTRDTADNRTIGPRVDVTLPLWNRNRGAIAVARATREQLKAEYEARLFQTRAEIAAAVGGIGAARRQKAELLEQLPALRRYADATARAARRGDLAPATADTAAQSLRDRDLTLAQLDQQIAEQTIALELLSGSLSEGWNR